MRAQSAESSRAVRTLHSLLFCREIMFVCATGGHSARCYVSKSSSAQLNQFNIENVSDRRSGLFVLYLSAYSADRFFCKKLLTVYSICDTFVIRKGCCLW